MSQTSREIVERCLEFKYPERMPRDLWALPYADIHFSKELQQLRSQYPTDFATVEYYYPPSPRIKGDAYKIGYYTDEWGCVFKNVQEGIIGEVKDPIIPDIKAWKTVQPPYEQLKFNPQQAFDDISRLYEETDKFVFANICPRPWERYQFLRGTENAMMDMLMPEEGGANLLRTIHEFYLKELDFWTRAGVDAIFFMDDWGAQNQLLIPPEIWRELFKPLYKDYCDISKANDKYVFMHSDGHISDIYDDLIDVGVDAVNSQLFCMDMTDLAKRAKGKITFWGEIDRQHVLPAKDSNVGRKAVRDVAEALYDPSGGIIAQFELGADANPETALAIFDEWEKVQAEAKAGHEK